MRDRERERDRKMLFSVSAVSTHRVDISFCFLFLKSIQAHSGCSTLITLSFSLAFSGADSLTLEVVTIGPES